MYDDVVELYRTVKGLDSELYSILDQLSDIKDKLYKFYSHYFLPPDDLYEGRRPPAHLHEPVRTRQDIRGQ